MMTRRRVGSGFSSSDEFRVSTFAKNIRVIALHVSAALPEQALAEFSGWDSLE